MIITYHILSRSMLLANMQMNKSRLFKNEELYFYLTNFVICRLKGGINVLHISTKVSSGSLMTSASFRKKSINYDMTKLRL